MKSNIEIVKDYLAGERPIIQVGYTGEKYEKRAVGEKWTDAKGQEWVQKESGPQKVNRVAEIVREAIGIQKCRCGQDIKWGSKLDRHFFRKTGLCENCLIDYETKLKILNIYDDYERYKLISNELGYLRDARQKIQEIVAFFESDSGDVTMICNAEGFTERWANTNRDRILEDAKKDLELVLKRIEELEGLKVERKQKYLDAAAKYNLETYAK